MFNSKKADADEELYFILLQVVLVGAVGLMLFNYINSFKENTIYDKNHLSRDIALVLNTLYMAPGNVYYEYEYSNMPLSYFDFYFNENTIGVSDSQQRVKGNSPYKINYPYAANKKITNDLQILRNPKSVFFYKSGNIITNNKKISLNKLHCQNTGLTNRPKKILFDFFYSTKEEEEKLIRLAEQLSSYFYNTNLNIDFARTIEKGKNAFTKKDTNKYTWADLIIIFRLDKTQEKSIKSYYYFKGLESYQEPKYLGCTILNSVLEINSDINNANIPASRLHFKDISDNIKPSANIIEISFSPSINPTEPLSEAIKNYAQ
ncbi:hypothetical protein GF323_01280 [Candidatus Woesearchaeota archaeon]|nr:hypothetical protein [Candidatus Woesearchaeota archaeon]